MSNKPDWKDAPEWAMWLVCNVGQWFWCEKEPYLYKEVMFRVSDGLTSFVGEGYQYFDLHKEGRP